MNRPGTTAASIDFTGRKFEKLNLGVFSQRYGKKERLLTLTYRSYNENYSTMNPVVDVTKILGTNIVVMILIFALCFDYKVEKSLLF